MQVGAQSSQFRYILVLVFSIFVVTTRSQVQNCSSPVDLMRGCLNCSSHQSVLNTTSNQIICVSTLNCSMVDNSGNCLSCIGQQTLRFNSTNATDCSSSVYGCKTMNESGCTSCISTAFYFNSSTFTCNLAIINYCWQINTNTCTKCSDQNIQNMSNCSISSALCPSFDYQAWICTGCSNTGMIIHPSGIFCYLPSNFVNCLVISTSSCLECNFGYFYNTSSGTCIQGHSTNLQLELLPSSYGLITAPMVQVCLNNNYYFNNITSTCLPVTSSFNYCLVSNSSSCITCLPTFYLSSTQCYPCSVYANCLTCDGYNCLQCLPSFYLVLQGSSYNPSTFFAGIKVSISQCLPCSIYSCLSCRNQFNSNNINIVLCDKCLFGYALFNHTCYTCPSGSYFSPSTRKCAICAVSGCQYCNQDSNKCEQCAGNNFYNSTSNACVSMSTYTLSYSNVYQILNKSLPLSSTDIINNQKLLIMSCAGQSNGFACLCSPQANTVYTSLCYNISSTLSSMTLGNSGVLTITNTSTYNIDSFLTNLPILQLLSELPNFNLIYVPNTTELMSNVQFANYLQILTNYIRNNYQWAANNISSVSQLVFGSMYATFDPYNPTTFSGPGYYFKYTPANSLTDDATVATISSTSVASVIFILFNSTIDSSIQRITGTTYIFLNQPASTTVTLTIKSINFLSSNQQYIVISNSNQLTLPISSNNQGYLMISSVSTSTPSSVVSYYVSSTSSTYIDQYVSQRIENIIYRYAFIYILVFLSLYLLLIPLCALTDCVDNKSSKRKIKKQQQASSYQGIKHKPQSQVEDQIVLKINYKDFFPIYNIANTERPKRLLKLCLFLVNSQHSVTFLTLIYFHLSGGQPLIAVLLAIPAYICTILMGYICGLITLKLPGNSKYLINLFTVGYWILWVPTMSNFYSSDYIPYVFTFVLIFFVLDMTIDFLQTLLMYFTIKQQQRQLKLFKVLSKWLSYRGYYDFDKMAKDINEIRDNS